MNFAHIEPTVQLQRQEEDVRARMSKESDAYRKAGSCV